MMPPRALLGLCSCLLLAGCTAPGGGSAGGNFFEDEGEATVQPGMHKAWSIPADEAADIHPRVTGINGKHFDLYIMTLEQYNDFLATAQIAVVTGTDGACRAEDALTTAAPCRDLSPDTYYVVVDNTVAGIAQPSGPLLIDYSVEARAA